MAHPVVHRVIVALPGVGLPEVEADSVDFANVADSALKDLGLQRERKTSLPGLLVNFTYVL
jgi:hypothetical protein